MFTVFKKKSIPLMEGFAWTQEKRGGLQGFPQHGEEMIPVLGSIPWLPRGQYADLFPPPVESELEGGEVSGAPSGEDQVPINIAYQWLAFTLKALGERDPASRTLLLTSSGKGSSSSWMSMNLAYYLHKANQRVLLIDGDFLNPTVHQAFDEELAEGSSLFLLLQQLQSEGEQHREEQAFLQWGGERLEKCIHHVSGLSGLAVMANTEGTSPADIDIFRLLNRPLWGWILDRLRIKYDWILVDSAPFLSHVAPLILAKQTGGILVFDEHASQPEQIVQIAELASINQIPLTGLITR